MTTASRERGTALDVPGGTAWRRRDRLPLEAHPSSVPLARAWTRLLLAEWRLGAIRDLRETTELVVSELVTNAVRATRAAGLPDAGVVLWLHAGRATVLVAVWDSVPLPLPPPAPGDDDAEGGRGLGIVAALATLDYSPSGDGKLARAVIGDAR